MDGFTESQKKELISIPLMKEIKKLYEQGQQLAKKKTDTSSLEAFQANVKAAYQAGQRIAGGRRRKMKGGGFFDDAWAWIKGAAKDADAWLKDTKALSKLGTVVGVLGMIPGFQEFVPIAAGIKGVAGAIGYGKHTKKHTGGNMYGMGINSTLIINKPAIRLRGMPKKTMRGGAYNPLSRPNITFGSTGMVEPTSVSMNGGAGTVYGSVYSEYSRAKF
jgi:hypothetical protein